MYHKRMTWLNYHHLLYFWVVAKKGTITAACKELSLAQPTVSAQLRALENALGHCCPVKSRIESIGWGHRGIRLGSRMAGVPVKGAFFRIA